MKRVLQGWLVFALILRSSFSFAEAQINSAAAAYNGLGFKLLQQTRQSNPGKNVFVSPVGLAFALSMVADGARGKTLDEIRATLQWKNSADLDQANAALLGHLSTLDSNITLKIANSLWLANNFTMLPSFSADMRKFYHAEAASVDFKDPSTAGIINSWVSKETRGKITEMVKPPLDATRLILLDAIYFKGDWTKPFDKKLTSDLPFHLEDGLSVAHPLMSQTREFPYLENDTFQAVALPYAGQAVTAYVFLPKKSLPDFVSQLTPENWSSWLKEFASRKGTLRLPRFKLENSYDLKPVLTAMGMPTPFSDHADFSALSTERLHIDLIKQKTYVDLNEQGTEAAAVTAVVMVGMAVRREPPPFSMTVDHPFFIALRENQTGAILFLGAILDPRS